MPTQNRFWKHVPETMDSFDTAYYHSAAWAWLCRAVRIRAKGWCEQCWQKPMRQVHHLTYVRFGGAELLTDLQGVCTECHQKLHNL